MNAKEISISFITSIILKSIFLDYTMLVKNCVCIPILNLIFMGLEAFWVWIMSQTLIVNMN